MANLNIPRINVISRVTAKEEKALKPIINRQGKKKSWFFPQRSKKGQMQDQKINVASKIWTAR